ncbi:hypothetical protein RAD15_18895 [Bradyrhizobium sp. 14AA]
MLWRRIFLGIIGLVVAFSAGGDLQLWIDEGKVWHRPRRSLDGFPRLLSYDQAPFEYVLQLGFCAFLVLVGLALVWLALGGRIGKRSP